VSSSPSSGVVFPTGEDGRRSTTATGRAVWADAVRDVDPALAGRIEAAGDWRRAYVPHVVEVTAAATRSPAAALQVARAGLASLAGRMRFERAGASLPVAEAVGQAGGAPFATARVVGEGEPVRELVVPYRGEQLRGDALLRQLERWVRSGAVEASCAAALTRVVATPGWLDLRDRAFALLGAAAELGPSGPLLGWGAQVAAVELPVPRLQSRLLTAARSGTGTLLLPLPAGAPAHGDLAHSAGADLLADPPQIARWLTGAADGRPLTVGSYAYADGARHVQVAVASDAVVEHLLAARPGTSYAELATPTDAYAVPEQVVRAARGRWSARGWLGALQAPARALSRGGLYSPSYAVTVEREDGTTVGIADVLVPQQGPNYTLAKRLQRWRAVTAHADGATVSANVAPATRTRSVTKNRLLAAAYSGASAFGVEVFSPATSRVLMAALLVHDLRAGERGSAHPDDLLAAQAAHGGLWRTAYAPRSVLGLAAVRGLPSTLRR
jgi:hypothetical protein